MGENIITWNVTNWITICIMAALGFTVLAVISQVGRKFVGGGASTNQGS